MVIIARYDNEIDRFFDSNSDLASRFAKHIRFDSCIADELAEILKYISAHSDSAIPDDALVWLVGGCATLHNKVTSDGTGQRRRNIDSAGNARLIRNIVEAAEE
ncbi:MAG: eccA1 [Nocardia sp.]|nr:eccA1 [Nocardia sp.]